MVDGMRGGEDEGGDDEEWGGVDGMRGGEDAERT